MTVNKFVVNQLNNHNLRELDHCPPHFFPVDFDLSANEKRLRDWIWENLQGRFYFGDTYGTGENAKNSYLKKRAAFEIHSEASYFAICLPELNKF